VANFSDGAFGLGPRFTIRRSGRCYADHVVGKEAFTSRAVEIEMIGGPMIDTDAFEAPPLSGRYEADRVWPTTGNTKKITAVPDHFLRMDEIKSAIGKSGELGGSATSTAPRAFGYSPTPLRRHYTRIILEGGSIRHQCLPEI
jgi:hypothetical protein